MIDKASPPRSRLRRYLELRDEKPKPFAKKAGIAPSTLSNFFNPDEHGYPRTLTQRILEKIAAVHGDPVGVLTGEIDDPLETLGYSPEKEVILSSSETIESEGDEVHNAQLIVQRLQQNQELLIKVLSKLDELVELQRQQLDLARTQSGIGRNRSDQKPLNK